MTYLDAGAPLRSDAASPGVRVDRNRWLRPVVWRRLPWYSELLIIAVGYFAYTRTRVAAPAKESVAFFHSKQVWDLERLLHVDIELAFNKIVAAWGFLGDAVGYYYGTLHFIVTPAVLIWLFFRRPGAYPRLRSTIIVATLTALVVFWVWPLAPPRFALGGAVDVLAQRDILNAANPHGISSMVNLYAAMPSLHVGWSVWCACAIFMTTTGRWRRLVWLYPAATTLVVIGTANHYLLDAVGGVAVVALGLYVTRPYSATSRARRAAPTGSIATMPVRLHPETPTLDTTVLPARGSGYVVVDPSADDDPVIDLRRSPERRAELDPDL